MPSIIKVAIIVDHLEENKRRTCFWPQELQALSAIGVRAEFELVNLLELMATRRFFDIYKYDVVIFNWCVLDGSVMYESDRVQNIVRFYESHFKRFVNQGGCIIAENQPKRWHPEQTAYDILFSGEIKVIESNHPLVGGSVVLSSHHMKHPMMSGLPKIIKSVDAHKDDWFPVGSTSSISLRQMQHDKVYSGAFKSWTSNWIPLLYTEDLRYPVMLIKYEGIGLWIATTMFIASSSVADLVKNLICAKNGIANISRYHYDYEKDRKRDKNIVFVFVIIVGFCMYVVMKGRYWAIDIPYGSTVLGNIILSISIPILLAFLWRFVRPIWDRFRRLLGLFRW